MAEFEGRRQASYNFYKARNNTKLMAMPQLIAFLQVAGCLEPATGISLREAKLCFMHSKMESIDELKKRQKVVSLTFVDFLECFARIADLMSPPTIEDLKADFYDNLQNPIDPDRPTFTYYSRVTLQQAEHFHRPSAELAAYKTRDLIEKLEQVVELVLESFFRHWGVENEQKLVKAMNVAAKTFGTVMRDDILL